MQHYYINRQRQVRIGVRNVHREQYPSQRRHYEDEGMDSRSQSHSVYCFWSKNKDTNH